MNQSNHEKFVDFSLCKTCKYWNDGDERSEKCHYCLEYPVNVESVKPVNYVYDPSKEEEEEEEEEK